MFFAYYVLYILTNLLAYWILIQMEEIFVSWDYLAEEGDTYSSFSKRVLILLS